MVHPLVAPQPVVCNSGQRRAPGLQPAGTGRPSFPGAVARTVFLGPLLMHLVTRRGGTTIRVTVRHEGQRTINEGEPVAVHFALDAFRPVSE